MSTTIIPHTPCPQDQENADDALRDDHFIHNEHEETISNVKTIIGPDTSPAQRYYHIRKHPHIIRSVRFNKNKDANNYYREQLMSYIPWDTEYITFPKNHNFGEAFRTNLEEIKKKQAEYNRDLVDWEEIVAKVSQDMQVAESSDDDTSHIEDESEDEGENIENINDGDLEHQLGMSTISPLANTITQEAFFTSVRTLNTTQKYSYDHCMQAITLEDPMRIFITGGAGVGKSVLMRALCEGFTRYYGRQRDSITDQMKVIKMAPTGSAAYNINGITIHSALKIPFTTTYISLTNDKLNTMRKVYADVRVVMLDEVSLISHDQWTTIDQRFQELKGNTHPFGGLHIIAFGDFFQLPPVNGTFLFDNSRCRSLTRLSINPWTTFYMVELKETMRQKDDHKFAELLNRLREGNHTNEDITSLLTRKLPKNVLHNQSIHDNEKYNIFDTHLAFTNLTVQNHNHKVFQQMDTSNEITLHAIDKFTTGLDPDVKE